MNIQEALSLFIEAKIAEGAAPKTIRSYRDHISHFANAHPYDLSEIKPSTITRYLAAERARGLKENSVYGRYRALDLFFRWCADQDEIGGGLMGAPSPFFNSAGKRIVRVKKPVRQEPRRASVAVLDQLIEAIPQGTWIQRRNRVVLRMLRDTGLRLGECAEVRIEDLNLAERTLRVPRGKGGKYRQVRLTQTLADEIQAYLLQRPPCDPAICAYLYVSAWNDNPERGVRGRLMASGIRQMLTKLCKRQGAPHINPHSIRHMFATKALNDGLRLETVSTLMGHADPSFTRRIYADLLNETAHREYDAHWV